MACFGEHRHFKGYFSSDDAQIPIGPLSPSLKSPLVTTKPTKSRNYYYTALSKSSILKLSTLHTLLGKVQAIESDFSDCLWFHSMGGIAWANCTQAVKQLLTAYMRLKFRKIAVTGYAPSLTQDGATLRELRTCIAAANLLLTVSHNNGKCLTKFVSPQTLNGITQAPGLYLMHPLTYGVTHESDTTTIPASETGTPETVS